MFHYFARVPENAAFRHFDGKQYAHVDVCMLRLSSGRVTAATSDKPRMMLVDHVKNGEAYARIGKAGDAIAVIQNLPFSVSVQYVADECAD